jgi:CheY-like chemotaxis protein
LSDRAPYRLLIVEDGADDRLIYRFMLERQAARASVVTVAANGEQGLAALRGEPFDCMLLDYALPDMTGFELLDEAIVATGTLPCATVIVTGNHDERIVTEASHRGVQACLLKDEVDEVSLFRTIDEAIRAWQALPQASLPAPAATPPPAAPLSPNGAAAGTMLTIAAAKRALAASFGVAPDKVEITIRG